MVLCDLSERKKLQKIRNICSITSGVCSAKQRLVALRKCRQFPCSEINDIHICCIASRLAHHSLFLLLHTLPIVLNSKSGRCRGWSCGRGWENITYALWKWVCVSYLRKCMSFIENYLEISKWCSASQEAELELSPIVNHSFVSLCDISRVFASETEHWVW